MPPWWPLVPVLITAGGLLVGVGIGWGVVREVGRRLDKKAERVDDLIPEVAVLKQRADDTQRRIERLEDRGT